MRYCRARVASWAVWRLPPALRWYVSSLPAIAVATAAAAVALTTWHSRDAVLFAELAAFGAAAIELTRHTTEPAGTVKDVHGIWLLPVALLLPPVYGLAAPVITFALLQLRTRRTIVHRQVASAAASGLGLALASAAFHLLRARLPWLWPGQGTPTLAWLAAAAGCALLWLVASTAMVVLAVWLTDRTVSIREQVLAVEPLLNDTCDIAAGVLLATAIASASAVMLLPALPLIIVLQRSSRHTQLVSQARVDARTGLLTASAWRAEAAVHLARAQHTGSAVALGIIDLDQYRAIHDQHGRQAGEAVLEGAAAILRAGLRPGDLLGRFGGEEFIFLLTGADAGGALQVASRLRGNLAGQPIAAGPGCEPLYVTISIGIAATDDPASRDLTELLTAADAALYRARQAGRDRVCLAPGSGEPEPDTDGAADDQDAGDPGGGQDEREKIAAARRDLGTQLAAWRARVKMTQRELGRVIGYSRGTVAAAEAGQPVSGAFWAAADATVGAEGRLAARHGQIKAMLTAARRQAARQAWVARAGDAEPAPVSAVPEDDAVAVTSSACPRCGEPLTVTARVIAAVIPQIAVKHRAGQRPS